MNRIEPDPLGDVADDQPVEVVVGEREGRAVAPAEQGAVAGRVIGGVSQAEDRSPELRIVSPELEHIRYPSAGPRLAHLLSYTLSILIAPTGLKHVD